MRGKRILFYDPDPRVRRVAERALRSTGSAVESVTTDLELMAQLEDERFDLLMINFDPPRRDDPRWGEAFDALEHKFPQTRIVLHVTASTEDYLPLLAERRFLRNMIAKNDAPLEPDELIITAEKLLRQDLFGLEKHLLWGVEPYRLRIAESVRKPEYVRQVATYATELGCSARTVEMVETIVDELVTNAIYNAPRTADGAARYAQLSRREPVVLESHEIGELLFACDGNFIAISQVDPFGSLTQDVVVSYLNRCLVKGPEQFSDASGGAGIGLFRIFNSLSKFIINIDPGHKTEVICLIDLRLSMKRFRQAPKSFHIFIADDRAPAARAPGEAAEA